MLPVSANGMSKRLATIQALVIISSILITTGNVSGQSDETVIDTDVIWDSYDFDDYYPCEGKLRISDGGSLTIRDSFVDIGCDITVDNGGILHLHNSIVSCGLTDQVGSPSNSDCPSGIMGYGYWDEDSRSSFMVPTEGIGGDFTVTMYSVGGASYYGGQAFVGDSEAISLNGTEHTFEFSDANDEGIWIGLIGYGQAPVSVSRILIETGTEEIIFEGIHLERTNMMGAGSHEFEILVNGQMQLDSSSLRGVKVSVGSEGEVVANSSVFGGVGPIVLASDSSSIHILGNSTFSDSLDDHDIRGTAFSEIVWGEEASGSGGFTDRWERRVVDQNIIFDAKGVVFRVNGLGIEGGSSFESFSDDSGGGLVNGGGERVVQIGWSNGTVWNETATVEILSYRTGWNPDSSGIGNYGGSSIALSWNTEQSIRQNTPFIEWASLEIIHESEESDLVGHMGDSVQVKASFTNSGTATASFYISCDILQTGLDADIGGYQGLVLSGGDTDEITFGWRGGDTGDLSLECEVLTPTQLVVDDSFGGGKMTTESVSWIEGADEEGLPMISILVAIVVAAVITGFWLVRRSSLDPEDHESEYSKVV